MPKQLVVIGGGAAGFFCAVNAARLDPSLRVMIIEKTSKLLAKVRVSGGGRCNVTHDCRDLAEMARKYPRGNHFVKKMFHHFFTPDTIAWFAARNVTLKTEEDGRMFPVSNSSQTIIDCLIKEANSYGVEVRMNQEAQEIVTRDNKFLLRMKSGQEIQADFVCVACGGYPKSSMFEWLLKTGHHIEPPVPSLFTFNLPGNPITALMGIAVPDAIVKVTGSRLSERGPVLITHWGLSGPAILRLSAWGARDFQQRDYRFSISIHWVAALSESSIRQSILELRSGAGSQKVMQKNKFGLPQRLWEFQCQQSGINEHMRWADLPAREQNRLVKMLTNQEFQVEGKTTFREEFVTAGGIRLSEIEASTMQSKIVPGLFFAGEIIDVDGITGGFNFQHAWSGGFIAAKVIASQSGPA